MPVLKVDSKGNTLYKGERERGDGRYEYRYTNHKGEKHSIYSSKLQQLRIEEAKIAFIEHKSLLNGLKEVTLNYVFEVWFAGKIALKENTLTGYKYTYDMYVRNSLGKCNVEDIKTVDVKSFYMKLKIDKCLSTETICRIQNILFQVFQYAFDNDMIWKNPAERATKEIKRSHSKHISTRVGLNECEAKRLTDYIYNSIEHRDWYPVIYIMIHTGLRLGELVSLRWCDINLSKKFIDVNHSVSYYAKSGEMMQYHISEGTKTVAGNRVIPFDDLVKQAFEMERDILKSKRIVCQQDVEGYKDFVFLNRFGKIFDHSSINRALNRIVSSYNLTLEKNSEDLDKELPHLSAHSLRHTYATILCERNINIKVIQMLLGHRDINTTLDIYTSVTRQFVLEEYAQKLGS